MPAAAIPVWIGPNNMSVIKNYLVKVPPHRGEQTYRHLLNYSYSPVSSKFNQQIVDGLLLFSCCMYMTWQVVIELNCCAVLKLLSTQWLSIAYNDKDKILFSAW